MARSIPSFLVYIVSFLLLVEWLIPVKQLADAKIGTFIFFLILLFLGTFIGLSRRWRMFIAIFYILLSINGLFYNWQIFSLGWIYPFLVDVKENIALLVSGNIAGLSDEFRTFLFFFLLWLVFYLIKYLVITRRSMFIFLFLTMLYITVLDTFTQYSADWAIVRTVLIGFFAMGMLNYDRIMMAQTKEGRPLNRKWLVPLASMIAVSIVVGFAAPKVSPLFRLSFFLKAGSEQTQAAGVRGVHTVGYGTDDSALGGPFIGDNSPVFTVEASARYYWKVETKDVYTGKGWIESASKPVPFKQGNAVPVSAIPDAVLSSEDSAQITVNSEYRFNHLVYPAGVQKITDLLSPDKENSLTMDTVTQRILLWNNKKLPVLPVKYNVEFKVPTYKATDLTRTTAADSSLVSTDFLKHYTQLPALPARIKELAQKITAGKASWYEKAKAIESYFNSPDYTYDQKKVAVPGHGVDYVDQFLFETKRGYCDNFSTSMAVMLRTLGIPARWVKGYTGGQYLENSPADSFKQIYQITNNNAHSWVEVYFPNQGWVPFEPTKGYTNDTLVTYDTAQQMLQNTSAATAQLPVAKTQKALQESAVPAKAGKTAVYHNGKKQKSAAVSGHSWRDFMAIIIIAAAAAVILYFTKRKWFPYYLLLAFRYRKHDKSIDAAYHVLLKQLTRYGLKRKENQTLRSYAGYIDSFFATKEMSELTAFYEEYLYRRHLPQGAWEKMKELWENLIKKTIY